MRESRFLPGQSGSDKLTLRTRKQNYGYGTALMILFFLSVLCVALIETVQRNHERSIRDQMDNEAHRTLTSLSFQLENSLLSDIYVSYSLETLIVVNPHITQKEWQHIAGSVLREGKFIRSIGLAPDDVIRYIYPLNSNQKALGLDYRTIPEQWQSVVKARESKDVLIAGPVELVQGGMQLIVRNPVFTDPPQDTHYWGVISMVIDIHRLLTQPGLAQFSENYRVAIRDRDSMGEAGDVFFGDESVFGKAIANETVHLPNGSWVMAVAENENPLASLPWYQVQLVRIVGYPFFTVLLGAFFTVYSLYLAANQRAMHDDLTQLPNRRYIMFTLEQSFDYARKGGNQDSFAILNIDLNKFKWINDTYGHIAGDQVLIETARRIKGGLRGSDIVARVGGDEFLVLLPRISSETHVEKIKNKVESAIAECPVFYDEQLIFIKVSVGYTLFSDRFSDVDDMLKLADEHMYLEKQKQQ